MEILTMPKKRYAVLMAIGLLGSAALTWFATDPITSHIGKVVFLIVAMAGVSSVINIYWYWILKRGKRESDKN
jgi:hypothetical protein